MNVARLWRKVKLLLGREKFSGELDEEMAFHREQMARAMEAEGMTAEAARTAATRHFGNATRMREQSHEVVGFRAETVAQDLRYATRQLGKNPGFGITAIAMLALGIGASTAIFGFVDAALIRPLPYKNPSRLVDVDESAPAFPRSNISRDDYDDWKRMNTTLESLDVYNGTGFLLRIGSVSTPVPAGRVSDGFFHTLGVQPMLGRDFRSGEDKPGGAKIAILSYGTWISRFGGRRDVVGDKISLNGDPFTVVGVLPHDFAFAPRGGVELWVPLLDKPTCEQRRSCHDLDGIARLRDGVSVGQARADLAKVAALLATQFPGSNSGQGASVHPLSEFIVGTVRPILLTLLAGAGLLLLIACVNVASLLLVRSESRRREIAVRGALGATSARLFRQFVTEALLLSAAGCGAGILMAAGMMSLLRNLLPKQIAQGAPFLDNVGLTAHVWIFAGAVTLLAMVLMAFTPTMRLTGRNLHAALSEGGRTVAGRFWKRLGANLVVLELVIAVVLLAGAGLLGKSLYRLLHVDVGFDPAHLATTQLMMTDPASQKPEQLMALYREIKARVASLPGVEGLGLTSDLPVQCFCDTDWIRVPGMPFHGEHNDVMERDISAGYLHLIGAKLIEGRMFTESDDANHPNVIIINQTFARKYFPGQDPVGRMIGDIALSPKSMRQVVGVVADVREAALDSDPAPSEYFSINHGPDVYFALAVRTRGDDKVFLPELVKALRAINPSLGVYGEVTMEQQIDQSPTAVMHELSAYLVGGFAALALVLGVVGLYGVVAYSVSQRTREIGVRMALGAQRSAVHRLILKEAGVLTVIGIAVGIVLSIGASMGMRSILFGVRAWDVSTLGGVAALLGAFALLASFIPARRAARVNPVEALRAE
ncbi:MAG TPA: ABC transporter permease [Acidobacteriaceae bacterium]|jgi:predicted permease|nr:ABC transporter permease [Acidobacteriaceae bacterium]